MFLTHIIVNQPYQPLESLSKGIGKPQVRPSCAYKPASKMVLLIMIWGASFQGHLAYHYFGYLSSTEMICTTYMINYIIYFYIHMHSYTLDVEGHPCCEWTCPFGRWKGTKCKSNFKEIMTVAGRCSQNTNIESEHCPIEKEHSLPKASVCVPAVSFKVCTAWNWCLEALSSHQALSQANHAKKKI